MRILCILLATLGHLAAEATPSEKTATPPNIVFILADDLGITDINAYASHFTGAASEALFYETPNLDLLTADGIAFSQSYANQLCSPTRAAILSGRIASKMGITTATPTTKTYYNQAMTPPDGDNPHDAFAHKDNIKTPQAWLNGHANTALDPAIPTLPRVLSSHDSAFLGKWHLGGHGVAQLQPSAHGFRELAYFDAGGSTYFDWQKGWNRTEPYYPKMPGKFKCGQSGEPKEEDYLTDDLSLRACDFIREQAARPAGAKPFLLYYCPFAVHTPLQAPPETIDHFAKKPQLGHLGHDNPTYAAMLKHLDTSIGMIRETLEETGLAENTIIVFTSDNGGVEYTDPAATDNQPFKGGKACLYEGGVRVPTIIFWPGNFEGGTWCDQVIDATDFLPTLADLTGNSLPEGLDGQSIAPLLENPGKQQPDRTLIWHYPFNVIVKHPDHGTPLTPHSAIRVGDHKLIWDWHGSLELYDIPNDPYEKNNLASTKPELTRALHSQLKKWLEENVEPQYFPTRNPDFDPKAPGQAFPFKDLR